MEAVAQRAARERTRTEQRRTGGATPAQTPTTSTRLAKERPLVEGDHVLVGTLGDKAGRIVSLRGQDARVVVGSLTVTVPLGSLSRTNAAPAPSLRVTVGDFAEVEPVREIDVRGVRVDEVDDLVLQALDAAVRNDLREMRIIHGKGTGALRSRVSEMLKKDTRVSGFRLGAWNEGGAGVTVAELS